MRIRPGTVITAVLIVAILSGVVAIACLCVSLVLVRRVQELESRLRTSELAIEEARHAPPALIESHPSHSLEGLRIALAITQDHTHPVFVNLLREQLLAADVTDISLANSDSALPEDRDILIAGNIVCNGYAEVYYSADLACYGPNGPICTVVEKPPHGDRPINLCTELIARLKAELDKMVDRDERRRALRELRME